MGKALGARDFDELVARGIDAAEARRQLELLSSPPPPAAIDRPCTIGDGILRLDEGRAEAWSRRFEAAAAAGRVTKMVPASGAATRMFRSLLPSLEEPSSAHRETLEERAAGGDTGARDVLRLASEIHRFAFAQPLAAVLEARGSSLEAAASAEDLAPLLDALLGPDGLALAAAPKGLIPFHAYPDGPRTSFAEHLVEALAYARDSHDKCRLHFTITPSHRRACEEHLAAAAEHLGRGARFEIGYSEQSPSTDTLALDRDGDPFRDEDGRLLLRPGGHGALLWNLQRLGGDLVMIKNVDNVQPDRAKGLVTRWKRLLGGFLLELESRVHRLLAALEDGGDDSEGGAIDEAIELITTYFDAAADQVPRERRRAYAADRLHRPLRVCGVVPNRGEPGGGPFWVRSAEGCLSPQIVEAAQIDEEQRPLLAAGTHFNPVDLVCSVRDRHGRPFDLAAFVDPATAFVTTKNHQGRHLVALEHPGLWNGSMAGWNTVFVEVPAETFSPVKTVFDLLRPEHQPAED